MTGVGDRDAVRDRVVDGVQTGRHPVGAQPLRLLVQVVQHLLRRQVEPGQGLRRRAQLTHDRRRGHGVPHDITDDQRDPAAGQRDRVVPVAAHPRGLRGRQVPGRQPHTRGPGQRLGQHGALQLVGDVRLPAVQHRLVDAERAVRGQLGRHQQVVGLERQPLRAAQEQGRADHPAPAAQRREDRVLPGRYDRLTALAEQLGQRGPGGGRVGEHRAHPAQHLVQRAAGAHLAQLGGERGQLGQRARLRLRLRLEGGRQQHTVGVPLLRDPVGTAQPQHHRTGGPLVADRQRVAQVDQDRVRERRHRRPAQAHHDLVQIEAAGDPPGGRAHEPQPVPVAPHRHRPARRQTASATALLAARRPLLLGAGLRRNGLRRGARAVRAGLGGGGLGVLGAVDWGLLPLVPLAAGRGRPRARGRAVRPGLDR